MKNFMKNFMKNLIMKKHEEADINIISYLLLLNENFSHVQYHLQSCSISPGLKNLIMKNLMKNFMKNFMENLIMKKHEEADINIISYLLLLNENFSHVQVKADDTDIFVLLVYYVWKHNITTQVSTKKYDGTVININETASRLESKCITLLPLHALTGCDTVSYPFGKGKISAANFLLKSDINLDAMCHSDTPDDTIIELGSMVLLYLYGCPSRETDLNSYRYQLFNKKRNPLRLKSCHQLMKLLFFTSREHTYKLCFGVQQIPMIPQI